MSAMMGAAFSIGFVSGLIWIVSGLRRRLQLSPEAARKLIHLGAGGLALSFPWLFDSPVPVAVACAASAILLAVARHTSLLPPRLNDTLSGVRRGSAGEFFFPLAVGATYLLARGNLVLYLIPVATLTFSDAAAALVGSRWGMTRFRAFGGRKSVQGSLAFFAITLALSFVLIVRLTGLDSGAAFAIALSVAMGTTLAEAMASRGTDNVTVPLISFLFLSTALAVHPLAPWIHGVVIASLACALLWLQRRHDIAGRPGYVARMRIYLAEMFPLPLRVLTAASYFMAVAAMARLALGLKTSLWSPYTLLGAWTFFSHMLLLRLMDELKDIDVDRELFPQRPVPSGRVSTKDIATGLAIVSVLFIVPNLGVPLVLGAAAILLLYSFLMFRFFFIPDLLQRNLLLNLATHNPVVAVALLYAIAVVCAEHGLDASAIDLPTTGLLIAFFWPATLAWEIARKIRSREEEDEYVTYSQIFGRKRAVFVVAGIQAVTVAVGIYFQRSLSLSTLFPLILLAAYAAAWVGHLRFLLRPSPATSGLRVWAEAFLFGVLAAVLAEYMFGQRSPWG